MQPVLLCLNLSWLSNKKANNCSSSYASYFTKTIKSGLGILYLHGGGYVVGSSKSHAKLAAQIGHVAQAQVWLPEYRL